MRNQIGNKSLRFKPVQMMIKEYKHLVKSFHIHMAQVSEELMTHLKVNN